MPKKLNVHVNTMDAVLEFAIEVLSKQVLLPVVNQPCIFGPYRLRLQVNSYMI